jgi:hypothetical protein
MSFDDPRFGALLGEHETMVLATVDAAGQPHATGVFFLPETVNGGLRLITALLSRSGKLANLRREPRAGVFIGPQQPTRWLQGECLATILDAGDDAERRLKQLSDELPAARVFIERVSAIPVLLDVRRLKLTDLTGGQPPIVTVEFATEAGVGSALSG